MARAVEFLNATEVTKALGLLPARVLGQVMRPALREGAKVVAAAVRREVLMTFHSQGSPAPHLADTIRVRAAKKRRRGTIGMVVLTGTRAELEIPATTKDGSPRGYYPAALQYGWKWSRGPGRRRIARRTTHGTAEGGITAAASALAAEIGTKTVPANPFMSRAFASAKAPALAAIEATAKEKLRTFAQRAANRVWASATAPEAAPEEAAA